MLAGRKMKKTLWIFIGIAALSGCGGGGVSGQPSIDNLEGTWRGNLSLIADLCTLNVDPLQETHEIFIDGDEVTLVSTDGRTLEGSTISDDTFEVRISDEQAFPMIDTIRYESIANGTANVSVEHVWSRPGGCNTKWAGVMRKD